LVPLFSRGCNAAMDHGSAAATRHAFALDSIAVAARVVEEKMAVAGVSESGRRDSTERLTTMYAVEKGPPNDGLRTYRAWFVGIDHSLPLQLVVDSGEAFGLGGFTAPEVRPVASLLTRG
jgi:hypothetical protein